MNETDTCYLDLNEEEFDENDFFSLYPEALDVLKFATRAFGPFSDNLLAMPSSPAWTATFENPSNGINTVHIPNLSVPENTYILYAGGYDMPGNQVGEAGPGKAGTVFPSRGQGVVTGALAADFATWGGSIAFDTHDNGVPRDWHFGIYTPPAPGQTDFLTIAFHELAHAFGFGTAPSFDNLILNGEFQGAATINLRGWTATLATDGNHWATGTTSPPYADPPLSALTTSLVLGRRRVLTPIDYAALADIGWQVPTNLLGLHGDTDGDGDVDGRDFLRWQRSVGSTGVGLLADVDGSQKVDDYDLWLWHTNFGRRIESFGPLASVPEPGTLLAGICTALLVLGTRAARLLTLWSLIHT